MTLSDLRTQAKLIKLFELCLDELLHFFSPKEFTVHYIMKMVGLL